MNLSKQLKGDDWNERKSDSAFSVGLQEFVVGNGVTSLDFTGLTQNTAYYFQVAAFNLGGSSAWSEPLMEMTLATASTPPLAPSNLLTSATQSSITLTWVDNATTENGFNLQIATDKDFSQNLQNFMVGSDTTSFMFYPLAPNTKYFMQVSAFNDAGSSPWVAIVDKTLK